MTFGLCPLISLVFNLMFTDLRQLETKGSSGKRTLFGPHFLCRVVIYKEKSLGKAQDISLIFSGTAWQPPLPFGEQIYLF